MKPDLVTRLKTMTAFLSGSEAYEGVWFGDTHPSIRGGFWWRTPLRALVKELTEAITRLTTFRDEEGRHYLRGWQDTRIQHDSLDREAIEIIDTLKDSTWAITDLTKVVRTAFFAGRNSLLAEMSDTDGLPEALTLRLCQCGHASCTKTYFGNLGSFYQGSGFEPADAAYLKAAYDFAKRFNLTTDQMASGEIDAIRWKAPA